VPLAEWGEHSCETPQIQAYVCQEFPDVLGAGTFAVRTVAARRTFWEKALLLHEETFRPHDTPGHLRAGTRGI